MTLSLAGGTGTALADTNYAAYRYLIARKDAQLNTVYGGVSARAVIKNTTGGGTVKDITVVAYIPSGLTAGEHFIQLYRTTASTSVPNDEMKLCYEYTLQAGDITNGYVTITDIVTDALLGAALYTSPSQQGISQDNLVPPLASDITQFKGFTFLVMCRQSTSIKSRFWAVAAQRVWR